MKLKCIGGECDGVIWEVEDYYKNGDCVRIRDPKSLEFKLDTFEEDLAAYRENRTPDYLIIKYYIYRICSMHRMNIHGEKQTLTYLCPHDWDEWETIKYQFSK